MRDKPFIVALTGAESTGKSTLAGALAEHYNIPFVSEFARDHIRSIHRKYTYEDVEFIAKKQIEQYRQLLSSDASIVILDTWLLITKVWFEVVFKHQPDWLEETIRNTKIDLFLVCDTDLPWEADDVRENGGENRIWLQERYLQEINHYHCPFELVQGTGKSRTQNAVQIIDRYLKEDQQI